MLTPYETNSDALRAGLIPCETHLKTGKLSRTVEPFHAEATMTVGSQKGQQRHVCENCAEKHHKFLRHRRKGVIWE